MSKSKRFRQQSYNSIYYPNGCELVSDYDLPCANSCETFEVGDLVLINEKFQLGIVSYVSNHNLYLLTTYYYSEFTNKPFLYFPLNSAQATFRSSELTLIEKQAFK